MQNFSDGKIPVKDNKASTLWELGMSELKGIYPPGELEVINQWIFEHFTAITNQERLADPSRNVNQSVIIHFCNALGALKKHTPVQYVVGEVEFYKMKFRVNSSVLIPRPETEELVDRIVKENNGSHLHSILDIGTGSGCIGVSLAKYIPGAQVTALDISKEALNTAAANAELNKISNIQFLEADALKNKFPDTKFDLIVSNPPYIGISERASMHENVLQYEPHLALFVADEDPLVFYRAIAEKAAGHLVSDGKIYLEINEKYGPETLQLFKNSSYSSAELLQDMFGKNRFIKAIKI